MPANRRCRPTHRPPAAPRRMPAPPAGHRYCVGSRWRRAARLRPRCEPCPTAGRERRAAGRGRPPPAGRIPAVPVAPGARPPQPWPWPRHAQPPVRRAIARRLPWWQRLGQPRPQLRYVRIRPLRQPCGPRSRPARPTTAADRGELRGWPRPTTTPTRRDPRMDIADRARPTGWAWSAQRHPGRWYSQPILTVLCGPDTSAPIFVPAAPKWPD